VRQGVGNVGPSTLAIRINLNVVQVVDDIIDVNVSVAHCLRCCWHEGGDGVDSLDGSLQRKRPFERNISSNQDLLQFAIPVPLIVYRDGGDPVF
jgi:hypothetical protein